MRVKEERKEREMKVESNFKMIRHERFYQIDNGQFQLHSSNKVHGLLYYM